LNTNKNAISQTLKSVKILLDKKNLKKGKWLLFLTSVVSLLDVLALATVVPVLMLAIDGDFLAKSSKLRYIFKVSGANTESEFLIGLIVGVVFFFIIKNIMALLIQKRIQLLSTELVQNFTEKSFYHTVNQPFTEIVKKGTSDLLHKIHFNSFHYATGILLPFVNLVAETIVVIFIVVLIIGFNPNIFILIGCITGPAFYLINKTIKNKVYKLGQETKGVREATLDSLNIGLNGIADMKINHSSAYFIKEFLSRQRFLLNCDFKAIHFQLIPSRANEIVVLLGVIILVIYGYFFSNNPAGLRVIGAVFVISVFRLIPALNRLLIALMKIKLYQYTIDFLLVDADKYRPQVILKPFPFNNAIELRNIEIQHQDSPHPLFSNVDLSIKKGQIIGITGISGSGKSTLLKLISGLIEPSQGTISIDGVALKNEDIIAWQNQIGFVHQSPFIFNRSLLENIVLSTTFNDIKLTEAIEKSGINEFLHTLPNGLETILGEQGAKISEGQKQRIAIARALYKKAKLLLLDEATSSLNIEAENTIIETIKKLKQEQVTIIIIAHQNKILEVCDKYYKLEKGKFTHV